MSIYSPFLDCLSFFLISQPYPFTPSSLSSTSRTSSCLHIFPLIDYSPEPSCGRTRQNRTSDLPLPLFVIHTKHTTQCLTTSIKKMGNICFRGESIQKIENEIEGLRNDIARLDRDRKALEMKAEGGRTTASDQTTTTTGRGTVGHHGGLGSHGGSNAIEELVPMRWRQGRRGGTRVGRCRSRHRAA